MRHSRHIVVAGLLTALAAAACTGGSPHPAASASRLSLPLGGTLVVGVPFDFNAYDPQASTDPMALELSRCCLVRALMSYNGLSTADGGATPQPDLASRPPDVSPDGLTWTFRLKPGIRYAPPLPRTEIIAQDFIRSMERLLSPAPKDEPDPCRPLLGCGMQGFFTDSVVGALEFAEGKADTISGLQAPDSNTLIVQVLHPIADMDYRFALPITGPIPADPHDPSAQLGVAEGTGAHYGSLMVASGPYMLEGSASLDLSMPGASRSPPSGVARHALTLVRNPSWVRTTDHLRAALADRIVLRTTTERSDNALLASVDAGRYDVVFDLEVPPDVLSQYRGDQAHSSRVYSTAGGGIVTSSMNLATPPFDDLHVRRAVNFAVDRAHLLQIHAASGRNEQVLAHTGSDTEERNLLAGFDPFTGGVAEAKREMAQSRYDANHDGTCDRPACTGVLALVRDAPPYPEMARSIRSSLTAIGISLRIQALDPGTAYQRVSDPAEHVPMSIGDGWGNFYPSASNFFVVFGSDQIENGLNLSLAGASPDQLRRWGYSVTSVPSVDDRIRDCLGRLFDEQVRCWAGLDQYLTEEVAPWIPMFERLTARLVSPRVTSFGFDQSLTMPALDRIALRPEGETSR